MDRSPGVSLSCGMGHTNLLLGLERKIGAFIGEHAAKLEDIERIEKWAETLPTLRERLWELQTLIEATEALLKNIRPPTKMNGRSEAGLGPFPNFLTP